MAASAASSSNGLSFAAALWLGTSAATFAANKLYSNRSRLMGLIDDYSVILSSVKIVNFSGGVGSDEVFHEALNAINLENGHKAMAENVVIGEWTTTGSISCARATFLSPIADYLQDHDHVRRVQVEIVVPAHLTFEKVIADKLPILIQLPATGDEGFSLRRRFVAKPLAEKLNMTSIIVQLPYYGSRRLPLENPSYALHQVEDTPKHSLAAVMEANALVNWLTRDLGFKGKLGITGVSFGGSMAALASEVLSAENVSSIAIISHIPANSPDDAYVAGALSLSVPWPTLSSRYQSHKDTVPAHVLAAEGKERVHQLLRTMDIASGAVDLKNLLDWIQSDPANGSVERRALAPLSSVLRNTSFTGTIAPIRRVFIQLSGLHDGYIPKAQSDHFYEQVSKIPGTVYAEKVDMTGGHCTAVLYHLPRYIEAIERAFRIL